MASATIYMLENQIQKERPEKEKERVEREQALESTRDAQAQLAEVIVERDQLLRNEDRAKQLQLASAYGQSNQMLVGLGLLDQLCKAIVVPALTGLAQDKLWAPAAGKAKPNAEAVQRRTERAGERIAFFNDTTNITIQALARRSILGFFTASTDVKQAPFLLPGSENVLDFAKKDHTQITATVNEVLSRAWFHDRQEEEFSYTSFQPESTSKEVLGQFSDPVALAE